MSKLIVNLNQQLLYIRRENKSIEPVMSRGKELL
jgi:hypothetical protein